MDDHVLGIYLDELMAQSFMAFNATVAIDQLGKIKLQDLKAMDLAKRMEFNKEYFRSIHSFLTHLSNISKLLWPPALSPKQNCFCEKPRANGRKCSTCVARERSKNLLQALDIVDAGHIIKSRVLRDHLEHFDERLDHWMQTSEHKNYVQDLIGKWDEIADIDESDMMRQYDPSTGVFSFREERYSLQELFAGLTDVFNRTRLALEACRPN